MASQENRIWEFNLSSIKDLEALGRGLKGPVEAIEDVSVLAEPVRIGELCAPNSLATHPMEGCDAEDCGRPGKLTFRRYRRFARGGVGLIWFEAMAVAGQGRANPRQIWIHADSKDQLTELVAMTRAEAADSMGAEHRPVIAAQLTHSGRYSKPGGKAEPLLVQRDPYRDQMQPSARPDLRRQSKIPKETAVLTDDYLDSLQTAYVEAAALAYEAGFDAVDIKSCHGYLLNEILAARERKGKYGGSFANRTRFLLEVIDRIHSQLGKERNVFVRLGVYDGVPYPYGWGVNKNDYTKPDLSEPKKLIALLAERGVKVVNVTAANPYYNPHLSRPFNEPTKGGYISPEHPLVSVKRMIDLAGKIQKEFSDMVIVGTGYSWLRHLMANVAAATKANGLATIIGAGRMAFAYPDFAKDILTKGKLDRTKVCVGCSACTQIMRDGGMAGCVVRDNKVYGPIFKHGRMNDKENLLKLAEDCLQCQEPTCEAGCPAGVRIPVFIKQFLEGDNRAAYETIREANILPEVCAWLCPVREQCEGSCLQNFIGDGPLPIADIQRHIAQEANSSGWSKLRIPKKASDKRVAIIGAGPAGIAAAAKLLEAGHSVTVFDKSTEFGGMVESVIPPDRECDSLKSEISAMFKDVPGERMDLQLGSQLDQAVNLDSIMKDDFDAAFVGIGLAEIITSSQQQLEGLTNALEFLTGAKTGKVDVIGKRITVIGGGNTAMDAAVVAKQAGAKDVYIVYRRSFEEMPAWDDERNRALNMGVNFLILTQQLSYNSEDGKLTGLRVCPTVLGMPDSSGRRRPEAVETNSYSLDMDMVIEAIGQKAAGDLENILPDIETEGGLVKTGDDSFETSRSKVYAGGDIVRGPSTVVAAVADGMAAASQIDQMLKC